MKPIMPKPLALAAAIALLSTVTALAQTPSAKPADADAELAAARADLERAAKRVAELAHARGLAAPHARMRQHIAGKPVIGVLLGADAQAGVRIAGVTPDGPASQAGLKSGDRLVSINGSQILGSTAELRVENARKLLAGLDTKTSVKLGYTREDRNAVVSVTPKQNPHVFFWNSDDGAVARVGAPLIMRHGAHAPPGADANAFDFAFVSGMAPDVRREIISIGPQGKCKGKDCKFDVLAEAFRWNGLNLATVDAQLGRYFGTDKGVLVLSAGEDLEGLQAGDVIQRVDGKAVNTPREAMDALRAKPADSHVAVAYLRDRKPATAQIKVPKAMPFRVPMPPPPPMPPEPPAPPTPPEAPSAKAAPHAVPALPVRQQRRIVMIDRDGNAQTWEDDGDGPLPPPPPMPPEPPAPPAPPLN